MKDPFLNLGKWREPQPYRFLTLAEIERVEIEARVRRLGTKRAAKSLGCSWRKVQYKLKEYRGGSVRDGPRISGGHR